MAWPTSWPAPAPSMESEPAAASLDELPHIPDKRRKVATAPVVIRAVMGALGIVDFAAIRRAIAVASPLKRAAGGVAGSRVHGGVVGVVEVGQRRIPALDRVDHARSEAAAADGKVGDARPGGRPLRVDVAISSLVPSPSKSTRVE